MPDSPRRARFQIHLSTAIVLMFVAGGLIWANAQEKAIAVRYTYSEKIGTLFPNVERTDLFGGRYGWPIVALEPQMYVTCYFEDEINDPPVKLSHEGWYLDWRWIAADALIALAILFAVWFLCEWLIRWRSARKGV